MIGREVIVTEKAYTLQELYDFMEERWDKEQYNDFFLGKPSKASIEEYIILPCTERFLVIVYPRTGGSLFSKDNKVILTVCDAPESYRERLLNSVPSCNVFFGAYKIASTHSIEKERKGPAQEALQKYTEYMKKLLAE